MVKVRACHCRQNGDFGRGQQTAEFKVEVLPACVRVPGHLGKQIGEDIRYASLVGGVQLWCQCGVEGEWEDYLPAPTNWSGFCMATPHWKLSVKW